jgi:predicted  nucleic acid-binding Zn-ribbon protein
MYPYVQRAIERSPAAREILWLFPGMEITCDDSVQCLMLFDQGTSPDVLRRLFGLMPKVAEPPADTGEAPQAILCGKDIKDFLGAAFADASFRGKSIVLPHASKCGHKDILRRGFHSRFADLEVDGVYNEKAYVELDEPTLKRIYGELRDWGDRRHGIITTGDNRNADYAKLGLNACWMRLGEPTAEAIRQAVLADEARIVYESPTIPAQRVLELRVNSSLTGAKFVLAFNDGFNSLIGGRGSGKSAVLEYLRFGLGRSILDRAEDPGTERERDLITSTLAGGFVEVDLERDGVKETWRRTLDRQSYIAIRSGAGEAVELPIATVQERFRARAFSQKQLSTLVRRPETADEQITGIAAAESVDLRRQSEQRIAIAEREIAAAFQRVVQGWAAEAAYSRAAADTQDLKMRVEAIRVRLEQGGLSPDQQAILDQHPIYARTENQFQTADRAIALKLTSLNQISELALEGWLNVIELPPVAEAKKIVGDANAKIEAAREKLRESLQAAKAELNVRHSAFMLLHDEFKTKYEAANAAQEHLSSLLADYRRLSTELEQAERREQTANEERTKYAGTEAALGEKRSALTSELTELRRILIDAAARVEEMSKGTLRARVEEETTPELFVEALTDLAERCGIRELEARCKSRAEEAHKDGGVEWEKLIQQLLSVRKAMVQAGEGAELDPQLVADVRSAIGWELTDNQAQLILGRLDDSRLGRLLSVWASPFIRFEYKDRGTYMPFERASPGQQASALLTLLLNQEAGTLIIDQPEDDLDNRVIMMIVKLLRTTKRKRQLIFATHNPNFVVNGDADKVVCLTPNVEPAAPDGVPAAQIEIDTDGAIETPSVRKAITYTMEGGREAFELRSRKYAFEPVILPEEPKDTKIV